LCLQGIIHDIPTVGEVINRTLKELIQIQEEIAAKITGMNPNASFGHILQQAAEY
jgi:hypothetical protein